MLFPDDFFCRYSGDFQKDNPESRRHKKRRPLRILCRDFPQEKSEKHHYRNNREGDRKHLRPDIGSVSDDGSPDAAEPERIGIVDAGVVAGVLQKMQEAAEEKRGTEDSDESTVPQKFQMRNKRKRIAKEPQPERQQRRHADDADR